MARILRGDVVWAELDPVRGHEQAGTRPIVVLSEDVFNARGGIVIAMAITSQEPKAGFPISMELTSVKLPKRSWALLSQVRTLSTQRLSRRLGQVSPEELGR